MNTHESSHTPAGQPSQGSSAASDAFNVAGSKDPLIAAIDLAMFKKETDTFRTLLSQVTDIDGDDGKGTLLYRAAALGRVEMGEMLLAAGATVECVCGAEGYTPLLRAAEAGQAPFIAMLLAAGANVNAVDGHGNSGLIVAAKSNRAEVFTALIEAGVDIYARNCQGNDALMIVSALHNPDMARQLLARGVSPIQANEAGDTPLLLAGVEPSMEVMRRLVNKGEVGPFCLTRGKPDAAETAALLLDHGAEIDARNNLHQTPLMVFVCNGEMAGAEVLFSRGADTTCRDAEGRDVLALAEAVGQVEFAGRLKRAREKALVGGKHDVLRRYASQFGKALKP